MDDNHYVTKEEYAALLAMARPRKSGGFVRFLGDICQVLLIALAVFGGYLLITIFVGTPATLPPPANAQGTPLPTAPAMRPPVAAPVAQPPGALPDCATVQDTRTACQQTDSAPAIAEPLPTEPPAPTATPAYYAACWTEPGQRPCWLPPDAPWTPLEEAPATPLVAVEEAWHAPMVLPADVCADWRPPAPWPEECE